MGWLVRWGIRRDPGQREVTREYRKKGGGGGGVRSHQLHSFAPKARKFSSELTMTLLLTYR